MSPAADRSPTYLADPVVDALTQITCELTAQLWTLTRRVAVLEGELVRLGGRAADDVPVSDDEASASARAASAFVAGILAPLAAFPHPAVHPTVAVPRHD